jgi:predicted enzyme related to lactoylglutathione lyase
MGTAIEDAHRLPKRRSTSRHTCHSHRRVIAGNIAIEVDDFDQAIRELKEAGTNFVIEPLDFPGCRMAAVLDPDRNTVTIHRRKSSGS